MIGFSMIVLTVIFGAAAFYRKKILDWFTESATRTISSRLNPNMQKTMNALKMVGNVGIAGGVVDWMSLRHPKNGLANTATEKPQPLDDSSVDLARSNKVLPQGDEGREFEGQTLVGQLNNKVPVVKAKKQKKQDISLNNTRALPGKVLEESSANPQKPGLNKLRAEVSQLNNDTTIERIINQDSKR